EPGRPDVATGRPNRASGRPKRSPRRPDEATGCGRVLILDSPLLRPESVFRYRARMAKLGQKEIGTLAKQLIAAAPGGIKYSQLKAAIISQHPETPGNTIEGS